MATIAGDLVLDERDVWTALIPGAFVEDPLGVDELVRNHPSVRAALVAVAPDITECFGRDSVVCLRVVTDRDEGDTRLSLRIKSLDGPRADRARLAAFRDRIAANPAYREADDLLTFGVAFA